MGNFSIETSFDQMVRAFPYDGKFELVKFVSSFYSNGIMHRIKAMLEARRNGGDINHVTGDVHYLALMLPGRRTILTIHDCGLMRHPNPLRRRILKWMWLDLPVRHCAHVTTVSDATRGEVIRITGCRPDKVTVIPTVISSVFTPIDGEFNEDEPTFLHIGMAPNKNFERHIAALKGIRCRLHIVGKVEPRRADILERVGIAYTFEYNITEAEMVRAYARCDALLFASTLEGFGMPIIEAQSIGRPVITSNISSMPEVAGEGAVFVDPYNVASIREGILAVIRDRVLRNKIVRAGRENAHRFSVSSVAQAYEVLYRRIHDAL